MRTVAAVEKELRECLTTKITLRGGQLKSAAAQINVAGVPPHLMVVDPFNGAWLDCVVHELIHLQFRDELERWGKLEEALVVALEDEVVRHINRSPTRAAWWRRKVEALVEAD